MMKDERFIKPRKVDHGERNASKEEDLAPESGKQLDQINRAAFESRVKAKQERSFSVKAGNQEARVSSSLQPGRNLYPKGKDIVIPVMGPTGAGKSSFINEILKEEYLNGPQVLMKVGYSLKACTKDVEVVPLPHLYHGARIVLVDTPGFDGTCEEDQATIICRIANWLKSSYGSLVLAGVIYLHDISQDRFTGAALRSLGIFQSLCGVPAFDKIIIGTTKHSRINENTITTREVELRTEHWKSMIAKGTRVLPYRDDYQTARAFIDQIVTSHAPNTTLEIQKELAVERKALTQTKAVMHLYQTCETDIVIPVMGPTGAGKSSFINELLKGPEGQIDSRTQIIMKVGDSLRSCTKVIEIIRLHHIHQGARILLVDTPGFDDSYGEDRAIIQQIANWLKTSYEDPKSVLAGVIYLHDISQDRFSGAAQRSLEIFESLCGAPAFDKVIIGTTKHDRIDKNSITTRKEELRTEHWKSMIAKGTRVLGYENDYKSARAFIDQILERLAFDTVLEIQKELVIQKMSIWETKVGQRFILHQIIQIANQRTAAGSSADAESMERLAKEEQQLLKQLKLEDVSASLSMRIRRMLGINAIARFLS